ncbi:uncharacterized protein PHACADRAFT_192722 [Phanerochaete carnosa HHB-10118-sp]|uniref:DUF6533 domain-containing protein n=1 Tax=Phanerochaete carnosa (strain HHB-10118-sp) TaxID=650164 RepID=K5WE49_PHACS|nr:uncharacterized protein PHACADRAFT_192722 [Phanerochaete carnosa HHB-10118-sp]EKM57575.1 hypothetical protein PHACADRAFT_192722 [Phanerochaete carnosa HHB-10118-sp]
MSSDFASEVSQIINSNSATLATAALIFYDHLITLDQEVRTVWQQSFSIVSLLIVFTRWTLLMQAVFAFIPQGLVRYVSPSNWINEAPSLVAFVQTAVFSALRVCAIWNRNYVLFIIVLVLSLPPVVTNTYAIFNGYLEYFPSPIDACIEFPNYSDEVDHICTFSLLLLFTRIPLIVADVLILILTWMKTHRQYREAKLLNIKSPLATCLIRDGTIYFFILLVLNASQILSFYLTSISIVTAFTSTLPQMLICRFMMNLRLLNLGSSTSSEVGMSQQLASLRTLVFNNDAPPSFMGNMGEPLDYDQDVSEDDDASVGGEEP